MENMENKKKNHGEKMEKHGKKIEKKHMKNVEEKNTMERRWKQIINLKKPYGKYEQVKRKPF